MKISKNPVSDFVLADQPRTTPFVDTERDWRCKGDLKLPSNPYGALVRNADKAEELHK